MLSVSTVLASIGAKPLHVLDPNIPWSAYTPIDLSAGNPDLAMYSITDPDSCQAYIDNVCRPKGAQVAYGGYLERRALYADKSNFGGKEPRNLHLGIDFWAAAGTIS